MSRAVWVAKKMHLWSIIKKVSDHYGGDDPEWLKQYAADVVEASADDLTKAVNCFLDLEKQLSWMPRVSRRTLENNKRNIASA